LIRGISFISKEAIIPISTVGQQIEVIANEAMELLVRQMDERKKRRPTPLAEPIHKVVTPILIRRETSV
jgi:LacI family sucrose operon transcriptional repressor